MSCVKHAQRPVLLDIRSTVTIRYMGYNSKSDWLIQVEVPK
jgi:hypothetical protein